MIRAATFVALRLSREIPNSLFPNQYENPANAEAHYRPRGRKSESDRGQIDACCDRFGTGRHDHGHRPVFSRKRIQTSGLSGRIRRVRSLRRCSRRAASRRYSRTRWRHRQDEMPANVDFSVIDEIHSVSDRDASCAPASSRGPKTSSPGGRPEPFCTLAFEMRGEADGKRHRGDHRCGLRHAIPQ